MDTNVIPYVIVIYGILFTAVLKIWDFILKLKDKEIDDLLEEFNEKIIKKNLDILVEKRQKETLKIADVYDLRKILDIPVEIKSLRKGMEKDGLWSFVLLVLSGVTAVISLVFPDLTISTIYFKSVPMILTIAFFIWFFAYVSMLNELREKIKEAKTMIQNKKII